MDLSKVKYVLIKWVGDHLKVHSKYVKIIHVVNSESLVEITFDMYCFIDYNNIILEVFNRTELLSRVFFDSLDFIDGLKTTVNLENSLSSEEYKVVNSLILSEDKINEHIAMQMFINAHLELCI